MYIRSYLIIVLVIVTLNHSLGQFALIDPQISREISEKGSATVILGFSTLNLKQYIPEQIDKRAKGRMAFNLLRTHNNKVMEEAMSTLRNASFKYQVFDLTSCIVIYQCDYNLIHTLSSVRNIESIILNKNIRNISQQVSNESFNGREEYTWGLEMVQANEVQEMGIKGQGVVVAGNDTGFEWTHPAIQRTYRGFQNGQTDHNYNWHDGIHEDSPLSDTSQTNPCGHSLTAPCDDNSHGTHTMGTMTGIDHNDGRIIGMAPEATWIAARNMERGNGSLQSYLETFNWFLAPTDLNDENPDPDKSPHVINNSWYCSEEEGCNESNWDLVHLAVSNLKAAGIVVVASAGNSGPGCNTISFVPAMSPDAFSVGATADNDSIARFSSRGSVNADSSFRMKPEVSAPGVQVYSSVRGGNYANYNGTSMAGPHVAGLVALIISANPDIAGHVDSIQQIIISTAETKTTDQNCDEFSGLDIPNPVYGYGRINALLAVEKALSFNLKSRKQTNTGQLKLYPNPANSHCTLDISALSGSKKIILSDLIGRIHIQKIINDDQKLVQLELNGLSNGVFIISCQSSNGMFSSKLTIAK